jgi:hypothetical protein
MTLVLLDNDRPARAVPRVPEGEAAREHPLRDLIFDHPAILPLHELDPGIGRVVAVAKELTLPGAGIIDVLLISEHGRLIVVECKLWRNPQARREVVGQVLEYASELARIGYEGVQRAISSRLRRPGNVLHQLVRETGSMITEAALADRVERDLAAGRFQLLVVGDGITEGAQRISSFLTRHAGLAFDLGLIEMAEYRFEDPVTAEPRRILHPRVLARTAVIERHVIRNEAPGVVIEPIADPSEARPTTRAGSTGSGAEAAMRWGRFVQRFVAETRFDDPAQVAPSVGGTNWMKLPLAEGLHISLWRVASAEMGAHVRFVTPDAQLWFEALLADRDAIADECATDDLPPPIWSREGAVKLLVLKVPAPMPWDEAAEETQRLWLGRAGNRLINSLRPRLSRLEEER